MIAVCKHELRNYFHSLTAYVFGAFLLMFIGIGAMRYNLQSSSGTQMGYSLQAGVANFEYVLLYGCLIFVVIIPVLTMRVIAEEKKQRTDQLLYSLPITTVEVVVGKFAALLLVFLLPLCIIFVYPLIFAQYGDVYLPTSYGSIFAFFVLGAALISIGMFISSLTDNQGFAAGIGIAVIMFNYYSVSLAEYTSSTSMGSLIAIWVVSIILGFIVRSLTHNDTFGYCVGFVLCCASLAVYWFAPDKMEGLLPEIMTQLSLFERFYTIVYGVFDLTSIIFYLTVIVFFLFLTVQSLEKRRYN